MLKKKKRQKENKPWNLTHTKNQRCNCSFTKQFKLGTSNFLYFLMTSFLQVLIMLNMQILNVSK